jgi:hypothetical protein
VVTAGTGVITNGRFSVSGCRFVTENTMTKQIVSMLIGVMALATSVAPAATTIRQRHFSTPEAAVEALVVANRDADKSALLSILGDAGARLIHSGDPIEDRRGREHFVAAFDEAHKIELEGQHKAVLIVGQAEWPLPIPLVRDPAGWRFDTKAGAEEILNRRIGRNELKVIEICRAYVAAQREYAALKIGGQGEFARRFVSTSQLHDGLYWPVETGETESPLGPLVAQAQASGYPAGQATAANAKPRPYYGYHFHILQAQGPNASGGAMSYVVEGHMTRGFALIAYPATFGDSGVMTFIVNQSGIVFEKNLGPATARIAQKITQYDPDSSWHAP